MDAKYLDWIHPATEQLIQHLIDVHDETYAVLLEWVVIWEQRHPDSNPAIGLDAMHAFQHNASDDGDWDAGHDYENFIADLR